MGGFLRGAHLLALMGGATLSVACSLSLLDGLSEGNRPDGAGGSVVVEGAEATENQRDASTADSLTSPGEVFYDDGSIISSRDAEQSANGSTDAADAGCQGGCPGKGYCLGSECVYASCKDRHAALPLSTGGVYLVDPDLSGGDPPFLAFCAMQLAGGGWTLLMKVDGHQSTFDFDSALWENTFTFQVGFPDLDTNEAKLSSYSTLPFSALLVGMHDDAGTRWTVLSIGGSSLRDLMATNYHPTALGRDSWMKLPGPGSLQPFCNLEGVNAITPQARVRIGILGNQQNDCSSCDSFIGFGAQYGQENMACGNLAYRVPDAGDRTDPDFGYIMAR
jgi:hypothetical protein